MRKLLLLTTVFVSLFLSSCKKDGNKDDHGDPNGNFKIEVTADDDATLIVQTGANGVEKETELINKPFKNSYTYSFNATPGYIVNTGVYSTKGLRTYMKVTYKGEVKYEHTQYADPKSHISSDIGFAIAIPRN